MVSLKNIQNLFIYISSFIIVWLLIGTFFTVNYNYIFIGLFFSILAYKKPKWAIYILLLLLPLFGNRSSQLQAHYLILYSSLILIGVYLNLYLNKRLLKRFLTKIRITNTAIFVIYLYIFISFVSLMGLPLIGMVKKSIEEDMFYIFSHILTVGETTLFSSVQSVLLLFQAFLFGLYIYAISLIERNKYIFFKKIIMFITLGVLLAVVIGHLDFFGLYDLSWYRTMDVGDTAKRLHSFFVNSTWFSQYLAITLPLLPIVLILINNKKMSVSILIFLLIVCEVSLILAMQRGAWITYPPTLFMIWISIYYILAKIKNNDLALFVFFKMNWKKVIITIPLTIILSIFIVYTIKDYRKVNGIEGAKNTFVNVSTRAENIISSNDRLKHWPPAIKLWKENPIFGAGGDSFGWQYKVYYYENNGIFKEDDSNTLMLGQFGTAHNLYLQTLVGKGLAGFLCLITFIFLVIYMIIKKEFLSIKSSNIDESIISLSILGSLIAIVIYANVQVLFYIQLVNIIFWIIIFIGISLVFDNFKKSKRKFLENIFLQSIYTILALLPFHIINIRQIKEVIIEKINFLDETIINYIILAGVTFILYKYLVLLKKILREYNEKKII